MLAMKETFIVIASLRSNPESADSRRFTNYVIVNPYHFLKTNDNSIHHPVISTVTHGAPAECVQWRNLFRLFRNIEIPPLRILR